MQNTTADHLARQADDTCVLRQVFPWPRLLQIRCDGGVDNHTGAGCGWTVWGRYNEKAATTESAWVHLASASWALPRHTLPLEAEFAGVLSALRFLRAVVSEGGLRSREGLSSQAARPVSTVLVRASARPQLWPGPMWRLPFVGDSDSARKSCKRAGEQQQDSAATAAKR